jgi:ribose/xylose/arabinose/galactoside ABC-type transport system permease subunit
MTDDARSPGYGPDPDTGPDASPAAEEPIGDETTGTGPAAGRLSGVDVRAPGNPAPADPDAGLSGDRVWVHFGWEGILLAVLAGGIGLWWLLIGEIELLRDPAALGDRLYTFAPFLLLATALAMSIRVRAANLAVGAVAALAGLLFVEWEDDSQLLAVVLVAAAGLAVGGALVLLVTLLRAPGWAASLGVAAAVLATAVTIASQNESLGFAPSAGGPLAALPSSTTVTAGEQVMWVVVAAVMAASVLGGVAGVLRPVRRRLHACREVAGEPARRSLPVALTTGVALLGSSLLAAAAGVLWVIPAEGGAAATRVTLGALEPLGIALPLAIAVLGGTSLWGKRGGVFGTLLAALTIFAVLLTFDEQGWRDHAYWITVGALAVGFLVSWSVEVLGTRATRPAEPPLEVVTALAEPEPPSATEEAESREPETVSSPR